MSKELDELDKILGNFAEELLNYDARMTEAGAPPVRFVSKYIKKTKAEILELFEKGK